MKALYRLLLAFTIVTTGSACAEQAGTATDSKAEDNNAKPVTAVIDTSKGMISVELYPDKAPKTVENFIAYANAGFYENTIFHRVIAGFMIQGGGFDLETRKKPTNAPIDNEATNGLGNMTGTIAMARTGNPHSATSQFFINVADNTFLDHTAPTTRGWGYTVFGKVVEGMDVVTEIENVKTGTKSGLQDIPIEQVVIRSVTVTE